MMTLAIVFSIFVNIFLGAIVVKLRKRLKAYEKNDSPNVKYDAREKTVSITSSYIEDGPGPPASQQTSQQPPCKQHSSHSKPEEENTKTVFIKEEENVPSLQHQMVALTHQSSALPTTRPDVSAADETAPQTLHNQPQQTEAATAISTKAG